MFSFGKSKMRQEQWTYQPPQRLSSGLNDYSYLRWEQRSSWWAVKHLFSFHLRRLEGLSQGCLPVMGCNSCIGAAIDGGHQHHETQDPRQNPADDDSDQGTTQVGGPGLRFGLTLWLVVLLPTVALRRPQGSPLGRTQQLPLPGLQIWRGRKAGLVQLIRDFKEVLSLPGVRWHTDDTVHDSPLKRTQKQRMTTSLTQLNSKRPNLRKVRQMAFTKHLSPPWSQIT